MSFKANQPRPKNTSTVIDIIEAYQLSKEVCFEILSLGVIYYLYILIRHECTRYLAEISSLKP